MLYSQNLPFPICTIDNTISQSEPSLIFQKDSICSVNEHELWHRGAYVRIPAQTAHKYNLRQVT